jgi:uncharacterized protein (TIGR00661 family)
MSCCGEGRGHAARLAALTEELLAEGHRVLLFAPGDAHTLLAPIYQDTPVSVRRIGGMRFAYTPAGRLHIGLSFLRNSGYLLRLPVMAARLALRLSAAQVDLVISDFEPSLPRAARLAGIPFLTVDHQSFLYQCDLGSLPWPLRWRAALMAPFTRAHYPKGAQAGVVSGFFQPPLLSGPVPRRTAGVLLRPEVRDLKASPGDHILAYFRRQAPEGLLDALGSCRRPVRVYGLGPLPRRGSIQFFPVSNTAFLGDLASCHALVSTAGNQLVGEALWLGKPVFAIPEPGNWEQRFNAWFLHQSGQGRTLDPKEAVFHALQDFLGRVPEYVQRLARDRSQQDGMPIILDTIREVLSQLPSIAGSTMNCRRSSSSRTVLAR